MSVTIDTISIEIESSSIGAAKGIDALAKSLEGLKKNGSFKTVSTNLNNLSDALDQLPNVHRAANALRTLANSIEKLKGVGTVAGLSNSLAKLPAALAGIGKIDLDAVAPQIEKVVAAVAPLSTIKAGGLNTMMNSLKKLGEVTKSLDTETINAFAEKVALLTSKLGPLSEKMSTIKAGFSAINSGARSAASGVDQLDSEIDASALNMSSFITIIQAVAGALQAAIQKFSEFISQAIEWDGIAARFGRSFGAEAEETYAWIQRLNEEMGINVQQFMQYSSLYAQMLTGFGVAGEDASKMALGYTELTYDIWASANDRYKSFEDAAEAVASAIAGEVEPIRRAGFTIVEATLAETAAYHGLDISLANATEAQKSYLRYLTLVDQAHSTGTIGVYAAELKTAEGMMRTFNQQLKSLAQAFGSLFLPILVKVMPYLQAFVELLEEGVRWIAGLFGIKIQDIGDTWKDIGAGAGAVDKVTDAADGATGALDDATKAAKELKNATLGIDELNVISPPSASSAGGGSGGSGGSGGVGGGGGFEGLDIDSLWDESIFDNIQSDVDAIKEKMRGWMPVIAGIATAFAGLRLLNLLDDLGVVEKSKLFNGGLKIDLSGLKEFTGWIKAFSELVKEGGLMAALGAAFPKISAWIAGLPAALSSASAALAAAAPYIGIAAAIVAGITLAFVDYDFTDIGYKVGEKIGSALKAGWEFIRDGAIAAFEWAVDALEIDDFWDVLAILFIPGEWFRRLQPEITELFNSVSDWINDKIENLKGNINEFFDGFFDGLFDGLGIDMSWAEKFTDIFDIEYTDIIEFVMNPFSIGGDIINGIVEGIKSGDLFGSIKKKFEDFVAKIKEFFGINSPSTLMRDQIGKNLVEGIISGMSLGAIKDKLSLMWTEAKTWWDTKKAGLASYTPGIGSIKNKLSSAWTEAKNWWDKSKATLATYTPSIGKIWEKLKSAWTSAKDWWNKSRSNLSYTPSIGKIDSKLYHAWVAARDWWNKKKGSLSYTPSIGSIKDKVISAWNSAKKWWSSNAKLSTKLNISVPKIKVQWDTASAFGKSFRYPTGFKLDFAAQGGIFDQGSLIWAGERGPEIMAEASGGRTGVMNVQQMQDAVYEGVYAAVSAAMRGMNGGGNGQEVRVFLDGREISSSVKKHQHESGATIMGNEVYAY